MISLYLDPQSPGAWEDEGSRKIHSEKKEKGLPFTVAAAHYHFLSISSMLCCALQHLQHFTGIASFETTLSWHNYYPHFTYGETEALGPMSSHPGSAVSSKALLTVGTALSKINTGIISPNPQAIPLVHTGILSPISLIRKLSSERLRQDRAAK